MAAAGVGGEADEAFGNGDFKLAVDLYTQAIDAGPATADLYADRARALVKLGNYIEALADATKSIHLNPSMSKGYLRKAAACIKLEEFQTAKATLQKGFSIQPCDCRFAWMLKKFQKSIIEEADEAYEDGAYDLAIELYTQAIDDGPTTTDLYINRAQAKIKLGNYGDAVVDSKKSAELDPTLLRAYFLECIAWYMLKEYQTAKAALELGSSYGLGDPRFDFFMKKCDQHITGDTTIMRANESAPTLEDKKGVSSTDLEEAPKKPRQYFYDTPNEIVVTICAKGENVAVHFGDQTLSVSFDIPGQEPYQFHAELFAKIIPENCIHQVFSKEIEIRLAKVAHSPWETLSKTRIPGSKDYEFSWKKKRLNGQSILPQLRNQGQTHTCVFQAVTAAAEIELKKEAANKDPPEPSKVKFSTNGFIADYENIEGHIPDDNYRYKRLSRALKMFKEDGVLAWGGGSARKKRRIKDYVKRKNCRFETIKNLIKKGRPVVGTVRVDEKFGELKANEIYEYNEKKGVTDENGVPISHVVVFIGYGVRGGWAYADEGFGRVYFGHAHRLHTIDV